MRATVAIVVALALAPGCSLIFMDRIPDDQPASATPRCTATRGFAAWDLAMGIERIGTTAAVLDTNASTGSKSTHAVGYIALALVSFYSAWHGFRTAARCREARAAHDAWLSTHR